MREKERDDPLFMNALSYLYPIYLQHKKERPKNTLHQNKKKL